MRQSWWFVMVLLLLFSFFIIYSTDIVNLLKNRLNLSDQPNRISDDFLVGYKPFPRTLLTLKDLLEGTNVNSTVDNTAFLPSDRKFEKKSSCLFEGNLKITGFNDTTRRRTYVIWDDPTSDCFPQPFDENIRYTLPNFDFNFTSNDFDVVPTVRRVVSNDVHPYWEYIPGPGKSWQEKEDNGWNRVALTFAVTEKGQNCVYNGLISFAYHCNGETTFAWYQINSQVCSYYQIDLWGFADVTYHRFQPPDKDQVLYDFKKEVSERITVKSITELVRDVKSEHKKKHNPYPEEGNIFDRGPTVNCTIYGAANWYITTLHECYAPVTTYGGTLNFYGILYKNVLYVGKTITRNGPHPYPEWYVFPQFSLGKSNFVSALSGVIDQIYGRNVFRKLNSDIKDASIFELKVSDWIFETNSTSWSNVTFSDLLDMASGFYNNSVYGIDEASEGIIQNFFCKPDHISKISFSINGWKKQKDPPGKKFVYQSTIYYLATRIMNLLLKKIDPTCDILTFAKEKFFQPLGLSQLHSNPKITYDGYKEPYGAWGSFAYADDMAKLAKFWTFDDGKANNVRIVSLKLYLAAMQMDMNSRGLKTERNYDFYYSPYFKVGSKIPNQRYHFGFWSKDALNVSVCLNPKIVTESGFGGLTMAIARGVWAFLQISDNLDFVYDPSINELSWLLGCPIGLVLDPPDVTQF